MEKYRVWLSMCANKIEFFKEVAEMLSPPLVGDFVSMPSPIDTAKVASREWEFCDSVPEVTLNLEFDSGIGQASAESALRADGWTKMETRP